jgi:mRNA-degrading endonuclease YafQ of YafQ-DinJ toxin-antitoxin module
MFTEAKSNQPLSKRIVNFKKSKHFDLSFSKWSENNASLKQKLIDFINTKSENPVQRFGASDYAFSNTGSYSGLQHAHLTQDLSLIYKLAGSNPVDIYLYGIYSHAELGTSRPPNIKVQKSMGTKIHNMVFEQLAKRKG